MKKDHTGGLDELMIVNPSPAASPGFFLGEDGTLYQVQGAEQEEELRGQDGFFLGEDGVLYQVQGFGRNGSAELAGNLGEKEGGELGRFFLGEDGPVYEVIK